MRFGGRKLLFKLILIGLLSGGAASVASCARNASTNDGGVGEPVQWNGALSMRLTRYSETYKKVVGIIRMAPDFRGRTVGLPTITIEDASPDGLEEFTIEDLTQSGDYFTFKGSWPDSVSINPMGAFIRFRVVVAVDCELPLGGGPPPEGEECDSSWCVSSSPETEGCEPVGEVYDPAADELLAHLNICQLDADGEYEFVAEVDAVVCENCSGELDWACAGESCFTCECEDIAEMAPTPIPPEAKGDDLPLPGAFHLAVVPVWRNGRAVSLLAEHDARGEVDYEWRASDGELSDDDQGGVVWTPPSEPGPHVIQVAVRTRDAAAVDTLRWRPTA